MKRGQARKQRAARNSLGRKMLLNKTNREHACKTIASCSLYLLPESITSSVAAAAALSRVSSALRPFT
jgi:hypothetical protein